MVSNCRQDTEEAQVHTCSEGTREQNVFVT